jgi:hypothetical protein
MCALLSLLHTVTLTVPNIVHELVHKYWTSMSNTRDNYESSLSIPMMFVLGWVHNYLKSFFTAFPAQRKSNAESRGSWLTQMRFGT